MELISKKNSDVHSILFSLVLPTGSINEGKSNSGITHLIEHLCFRKASKSNQKDIYDFCESSGVKINAVTGKNFLWFYFKTRISVYDDIVKLFHKMFYETEYSENDLLIEKNIIKAEIDCCEQSNESVIIDRLWCNKKFANKILGSAESLDSLSLENVIKFKRKLLKIGGTVFLFGNYSDNQYKLTQNLFHTNDNTFVNKSLAAHKHYELRNEIKFINDDYDNCDVYYALRFYIPNEEKYKSILCLQMLNSVLFQGDAAYITETLREKFGYIYEVESRLEILNDEAILIFNLHVKKEYINETVRVLENLLKSFVFNDRYYKYIKAFFYDNFEMLYDNFDLYFEQYVENYITFGESICPEEKVRMLNNISVFDYNRIYNLLIKNKSVYIFGNISSSQKKKLYSFITE